MKYCCCDDHRPAPGVGACYVSVFRQTDCVIGGTQCPNYYISLSYFSVR